MTDLEVTRLCAKAMGINVTLAKTPSGEDVYGHDIGLSFLSAYHPIENDEQAMHLVKKFRLRVSSRKYPCPESWVVYETAKKESIYKTVNENLNRAICQCVAKMQASAQTQPKP